MQASVFSEAEACNERDPDDNPYELCCDLPDLCHAVWQPSRSKWMELPADGRNCAPAAFSHLFWNKNERRYLCRDCHGRLDLVYHLSYKSGVCGAYDRRKPDGCTLRRHTGEKIQTWVFLFAGALAGLAGAVMVVGVEGRMRISAGETMGFMGFLAAGMAGNNPLLLILSALLIGGLTVAGNGMEINTGLPAATMQILIMLVLLTIMTVGGKRKA